MNKSIGTLKKRMLISCILFFSFLAVAAARPNVGLVLSGGGAKGIAHIGVIKALEEKSIPFDCVAGTSAGAIVGSLYACGWTPEEILGLFTSPEFKYWSSGTIAKSNIYYESQPMPMPVWADFGIALGKQKKEDDIFSQIIPTNLISPIPMNLEFLQLYSPYTAQCRENFDNLFVPLRTVCSDVYHKHKVVCSSGSVGDAVRASMSFPLVFKAIEMDGVLVYDGGIYDNFPVDVMHEDFNPRFIIGVSVSGPDGKPLPDNLYSQLEDMIIQNNNYDLPEKWGVKIQVPVLDFATFDWDAAHEIYEIGYKTGLEMADSILARCPYRRSPEELAEMRKQFKANTPVIDFDKIIVEGANPPQDLYIKELFTEGKQKSIGIEQVKAGYYRAVTTGKLLDLFPQAQFTDFKEEKEMLPDSSGAVNEVDANLLLKATVKQPWNIGVGGWITSSIHSQLFLTFGYHTLSLSSLDVDLSAWVGQSYYAGMLSGAISLPSRNPSSLRLMGVASKQKLYQEELMFYQNRTPGSVNEAQQYIRLEYSLAAGKAAKGYGRISYGHILDEYFPYHSQIDSDLHHTDYQGGALEIGFEANTLDNLLYPMAGRFLNVNALATYLRVKNTYLTPGEDDKTKTEYVKGSHLSASVMAHWKQFFPLHKNFTVGGMAEGLVTFSKLYQSYMATLVHSPAFAPTPSTKNYFNMAFRAENYVAIGVVPIWTPVQKLQIRGDFYYYSPIRHLVPDGRGCRYNGWFRKSEFIGELAAVYNFKFASLSLYCNYLTYPARNWNFGLNLGLLFQAPKFAR